MIYRERGRINEGDLSWKPFELTYREKGEGEREREGGRERGAEGGKHWSV